MPKKRGRWRIGDIAEIDLGKGEHSYCWVLKSPLVAFFDLRTKRKREVPEIVMLPIAFKIWVMKYALTSAHWPVIGKINPPPGVLESPKFFRQDALSGELSIYKDGKETPATKAECRGLECAAVWDPEHVEDRLRDHFEGKPNRWVQSLRIKS
jgi:hypothetical protein